MSETPNGTTAVDSEEEDPRIQDEAGESGSEGTSAYQIHYSVRTHTGLVRDHNEDDFLVMPEHGVFLVADGMGGHAAGKVASGECVKTVRGFFNGEVREVLPQQAEAAEDGLSETAVRLARALRMSNRRIFEQSTSDRELAGMGTTAVGIRVFGKRCAIAHAGDSRCYLLRNRRLTQLTVDHSLSNFLLALGREVEAQMAEATMSNVIMRALGLEPDVVIDTQETDLEPGDRFLLCSDGLSDLAPDKEIEAMLASPTANRDEIADQLIQAALDAGGRDNVTVMILDVDADGGMVPIKKRFDDGDTLPMTPLEAVPGLEEAVKASEAADNTDDEEFDSADTARLPTIAENDADGDEEGDGDEEDEEEDDGSLDEQDEDDDGGNLDEDAEDEDDD